GLRARDGWVAKDDCRDQDEDQNSSQSIGRKIWHDWLKHGDDLSDRVWWALDVVCFY
ncbi:MAG: hypothetical protein ACI9KS_000832, partial [Sulfitobacter sp.]